MMSVLVVLMLLASLVVAGIGVALLVWLLWWLSSRDKEKRQVPAPELKSEPAAELPTADVASEAAHEISTPIVVLEPEVQAPEAPSAAVLSAAVVFPAAAVPVAADDLTRIEGIGPKIAGVLQAAGITTFAQLADAHVDHLHQILGQADPRLLRLASPATWPEQSALASAGAWEALEALQNQLKAGRRA
jgi:predicted flap endonuclease-1-like 5' DNA nuclease